MPGTRINFMPIIGLIVVGLIFVGILFFAVGWKSSTPPAPKVETRKLPPVSTPAASPSPTVVQSVKALFSQTKESPTSVMAPAPVTCSLCAEPAERYIKSIESPFPDRHESTTNRFFNPRPIESAAGDDFHNDPNP